MLSKDTYTNEIVARLKVFLEQKLADSGFDSVDQIQFFALDTRSANTTVIKAKAAVKYHNDVWFAAKTHISGNTYPTALDPQIYIDSIAPPSL